MVRVEYDKIMHRMRMGDPLENFTDESLALTDDQKLMAQANLEDTAANAQTGKLGYNVLQANRTFAEQVTATNTIYEIRDVFDLGGTAGNPVSLTVPVGCTLRFNGGMLKNCTLVGQNSIIEASGKIFDNVTVTGSWACVGKVAWWAVGCHYNNSNIPIDNDETAALQLALDSSFKELVFEPVPYCITNTLILRNAKNLRLAGLPNTTIASSGNTKKANATYIYTRSNIEVLNVSVYNTDPLQKIVIEGGAFDASLSSTYTSNLIHVSTGDAQRVWGMEINTTLFGKNTGYVIPGGYGIMIGSVTGTSAAGHATMIRINSHFQYLNTAVYILAHSSPDVGGWVTDVVVDGECSSCAKAVYTNAGNTDVRLSIQTAGFFDENTKETNAAITFDATRSSQLAFSVSSWVWDMDKPIDEGERYTNAKSLEILGNARVEIYGSFATQAALQGKDFLKRILGSVNQIYGRVGNLPRSIQFPYDFNRFVPNALNDILLGADLTGLVTTSAKLMRYSNGEYSEDESFSAPTTLPNLYRDNSDGCTIAAPSGSPMGDNDYFQLEVEFDDSVLTRIGKMFLYFRKFSAESTINNQPAKCEAYLLNGENVQTIVYASSPIDYSVGGFFGDYIEFGAAGYSYLTKKIVIKIFAPNATQVVLYRLSAFAFFNNSSIASANKLYTPYLSRCGGDVCGPLNMTGNLNVGSNLTFGEGAKVNKIPFNKVDVISNNNSGVQKSINLLPKSKKTYFLKFTPSTDAGVVCQSYLVYIEGYWKNSPNYRRTALYELAFFGNNTGGDNTKKTFVVQRLYGTIKATIGLYYKEGTENTEFLISVADNVIGLNTNVSILNADEYLSITSATATPSGYTQRASTSSKYITIEPDGDTASRPSTNYIETGFQYFDTDLGKQIVYNGMAWVNIDGSELVSRTIANILDHVTNSNTAASIDNNATYMATLSPDVSYEITGVSVTMGGTNITSFVYNVTTHVIYIPAVTGDLVITATSVAV